MPVASEIPAMTQRTGTVLDRIVADNREELATAQRLVPFDELEARLPQAPPPRQAQWRPPGSSTSRPTDCGCV